MTFLTKGPSNHSKFLTIPYNNDLYFVNLRNGVHKQFNYSTGLKNIFGHSLENSNRIEIVSQLLRTFVSSYKLDDTPLSEINEKISDQKFSEIDNKLRKRILKVKTSYKKLGQKYNVILSKYRYMLHAKMQPLLDLIVSYISPKWSEACYLAWTKDFGTFVLEKVINENYPIYLLAFVELHIMSGYDTYLHRKFDIKKDIEPFLKRRSLDPYYDKLFKKNISEVINSIEIGCYKTTFEDFVKYRDNWNLMGSATIGIPMKLKTKGFKKPTRIGSKTTNLMYYDDPELLIQLRKWEGHKIRPFLKTDEPAKSRVVIGYDTRSYIRCSYLESFIKRFNKDKIWTSVGFTPADLFEVRNIVNDNIKSSSPLRMICTDQSAFDQHQYKHLFIYGFSELCKRIARDNPQIREVVELEMYGLQHAYIELPDGSRKPWENGLLSGHKFTALLGSVLNCAATKTCLELAGLKDKFSIFQGDDALLMLEVNDDYDLFLQQYRKLDMVVNPMKTWHGINRTEYLHQVYIRDRVISLSTRSALGLIFKDPKSVEVGPDQWFMANLDQIRMAARRGLDVEIIAKNFVSNFVKKYDEGYNSMMLKIDDLDDVTPRTKSRMKKKLQEKYDRLVDEYLHTPTLYGGGGFEPYKKEALWTINFTKVQEKVDTSIISPYHYVIAGDADLTKRWILKKIYDHLPAPEIKTRVQLQKVDKRTNHKEMHYYMHKVNFAFDKMKTDNTSNWINHVKSLLNEACEYGNRFALKFSKARSRLSSSFNLISSVTNAFLGKSDKGMYEYYYRRAVEAYLSTKFSITSLIHYLNGKKEEIWNQYRSHPPIWYDYCFSF